MNAYEVIRNRAGLLDLADWGRFEVSGADAATMLDRVVGANMPDLFDGRAVNTLIANEQGGVDAVVWVIAYEEHFLLITEPGDKVNTLSVLEEYAKNSDVIVRNVSESMFGLALVGPQAEVAASMIFGDDIYSIAFLGALSIGEPELLAVRLGYVGEYELHLFGEAADKSSRIEALLEKSDGALEFVDQVDHPRMMAEMRSLNRERDVPADVSAFECGLQWMIDFRKQDFRGKAGLESAKANIRRKCILILVEGDVALSGASAAIENTTLGEVRCAYYSPTLSKTIVIAYLDEAFAWPGLKFTLSKGDISVVGKALSAPAFLSQSVLGAQQN